MPRSDRSDGPPTKLIAGIIALIAVAVVIAAVVLGLGEQAKYRQEADQRSADYAEHTRDQIDQTCAAVAPPEQAGCVEKATTEQQLAQADNERNENDLVAQRTSALWTAIMGVAALVGMGLSAVGVWLVFDTFRATRRATDIANDNLLLVIETERAVIRATDYSEVTVADNRPHMRCLDLPISNLGNGNATIRRVRWMVKIDGDWPDKFDEETKPNVVVEGQSERTLCYLEFLPPDENCYFVLGDIAYDTIAGRSFDSYFCYKVSKMRHDPLVLRLSDTMVNLVRYRGHPENT